MPNALKVCNSPLSVMPFWFLSCQTRTLLKSLSLLSKYHLYYLSNVRNASKPFIYQVFRRFRLGYLLFRHNIQKTFLRYYQFYRYCLNHVPTHHPLH